MNATITSIEAETFWRNVIAAEIRTYSDVSRQVAATPKAGETLSVILRAIADKIAVPPVKS